MNINWKELCDGKTAVHTPNREDAVNLIDMLKSVYPNTSMLDAEFLYRHWNRYEDRCCYRFTAIYKNNVDKHPDSISCSYCYKEWYEERSLLYRVLEFNDIFKQDFGQIESDYLSAADVFAALF